MRRSLIRFLRVGAAVVSVVALPVLWLVRRRDRRVTPGATEAPAAMAVSVVPPVVSLDSGWVTGEIEGEAPAERAGVHSGFALLPLSVPLIIAVTGIIGYVHYWALVTSTGNRLDYSALSAIDYVTAGALQILILSPFVAVLFFISAIHAVNWRIYVSLFGTCFLCCLVAIALFYYVTRESWIHELDLFLGIGVVYIIHELLMDYVLPPQYGGRMPARSSVPHVLWRKNTVWHNVVLAVTLVVCVTLVSARISARDSMTHPAPVFVSFQDGMAEPLQSRLELIIEIPGYYYLTMPGSATERYSDYLVVRKSAVSAIVYLLPETGENPFLQATPVVEGK